MFLLSGQRRLLDANPAWERLTGLALAEARGQICKRRASTVEPLQLALSALAPPQEAMQGRACQTRRRAPGRALAWWEIDFLPWSDANGPIFILARIRVIQESAPVHAALPERLIELRTRRLQSRSRPASNGDAPVMRRFMDQIRLAAHTRMPALILGPQGCGKAWAARAIHDLSPERDSFFANFDARLPTAALADLVAIARTAQIGTLYLSNAERLAAEAQTLLLQFLDFEKPEAHPRLLAGSAVDLAEAANRSRFLPELHGRLSALTIRVPALRERLHDLPTLVNQLLPRAAAAAGHAIVKVSGQAMELLQRHTWPGNTGELYDVVVQACRRAKSDQIDVDDFPFHLRAMPGPPPPSLPLDDVLAKLERRLIELALSLTQGNKAGAAELLAIWRPRLLRRMEHFGMAAKDDEDPAGPDGPVQTSGS